MMTLTDLIEQLQRIYAPMPEDADLGDWRQRIDDIDEIILELLNARSVSANEIGHIKKIRQIPVYVPKREEEVLRHVMSSNNGPLPDAAVRRLFERIIDETRSLERHKYQGD